MNFRTRLEIENFLNTYLSTSPAIGTCYFG